MTRGASRTIAVPRPKAEVYLRRGRNLMSLMELAEEQGNHDGVATTGVQAAIAFADAYTIGKLGLRNRGQDHHEAVGLISRVATVESSKLAGKIQSVLNRKSEVEYGDREVGPSDAARISANLREISKLVETALK